MYAASRLRVPASVRSKPLPSESRQRRAIGDLPGRSGVADSASLQRSQPARARWKTRCRPSASRSRNLPCRATPVDGQATQGLRRRVVGLEHADRAELHPRDGKAVGALARKSASAWTSGSSGTRSFWPTLSADLPVLPSQGAQTWWSCPVESGKPAGGARASSANLAAVRPTMTDRDDPRNDPLGDPDAGATDGAGLEDNAPGARAISAWHSLSVTSYRLRRTSRNHPTRCTCRKRP